MASDKEEYQPGMQDQPDPRRERLLRDLRELPQVALPAQFEARLRERLSRAEAPLPWFRRFVPEPGVRSFRIPALAYGSIALIAICVIGYYAFLRTDFTRVQNGPIPESDISHPVKPEPPQSGNGTPTGADQDARTRQRSMEERAGAGKTGPPPRAEESPAVAPPPVAPVPVAPPAEGKKESDEIRRDKSAPQRILKRETMEMQKLDVAPANETKPSDNAPALLPARKDLPEYRVRGIVREGEVGAVIDSTILRDSLAARDSLARMDSLARATERKILQPKK